MYEISDPVPIEYIVSREILRTSFYDVSKTIVKTLRSRYYEEGPSGLL